MSAKDLYFVLVIFNIVAGIAVLVFRLYIANFELAKIIAGVRNSPGVEVYKSYLDRSLLSRSFAVVNVAAIVFFYKKSIKNGRLDEGDYDNFPSSLKFRLKAMYSITLLLGLMMLVLFALGKYCGWLK